MTTNNDCARVIVMQIRAIASVELVIVLALTAFPAHADWTGYADFTTCPRQYIPQTSGTEAFATEAACNARIAQVQRETPLGCARFTCKDNAAGGAPSNNDPITQAISAGVRTMTPQQTLGAGIGLLGVAAILQGLNSQQQQTSDQAAAAAQQAAILRQHEQQLQDQRAEATKQELLHSLKGTGAATDLALKDTGAGAELQLKTGDTPPRGPTVIHGGFSLPISAPDPQ
jgi:hypothetical protein